MVYNIPATMIEAFRGRDLIVRSHDPAEILQRLLPDDLERMAYLQILGTGGAIDPLMRWGPSIPVDLVVQNLEADLPLLYRYSPLLAERPVRVSVPVVAGFSKVVKLALSLNFAVKLEVSQPEPALIEELLRVATLYLHQSTVSQPVEFIHSIFLAFYNRTPVTLWAIQEEDPAPFSICYRSGGRDPIPAVCRGGVAVRPRFLHQGIHRRRFLAKSTSAVIARFLKTAPDTSSGPGEPIGVTV